MSDKKNKIVFVVGFPRSGTTWFSNLLNAHPEVIYRHEIVGRCYKIFGDELFDHLKFNHGLSVEEHNVFLKKLALANVETDRPPFFHKTVLKVASESIHKTAWLATKSIPLLNNLYQYLFTPNPKNNTTFLLKETRSTINLDSIIKGVAPSSILFLFREPYGAIASHVKGLKLKAMDGMSKKSNETWLQGHAQRSYVKELYESNFDFNTASDVEILAIKWRVYNDDLLELRQTFSQTIFCHYDQFVQSPIELTKQLFHDINLDFVPAVEQFISASGNKDKKQNILQKDASNDFFSVYRSADFNKEQWKDVLSTEDIKIIDKHTKSTFELLVKACN